MGRLKVWDTAAAAFRAVEGFLAVRDESNSQSEPAAQELIFPDYSVFPQGDGSVVVREVPTGVIGCYVGRNSTQSISAATHTPVDLDVETIDTDGFHSTSVNPSRFTVPAYLAGDYLAIFSVQWPTSTTAERAICWHINGTHIDFLDRRRMNDSGVNTWQNASHVVRLNAGDYYEFNVYQNTAGAINLTSAKAWFYKLGGGNVAGLPTARYVRTSGSWSLTSTTWADVDTVSDLTIPAQVDDTLQFGLNAVAGNEARVLGLDVVTVVGGVPVTSCSGQNGASDFGFAGWTGATGAETRLGGGPVQYKVVAADLSGGNVTVRLRYRVSSAGTKTLYAAGAGALRFEWNVVNLKGGAASRDIGYEFAYAERTSDATVSQTVEASSDTLITAPAATFDGNTAVIIEAYLPEVAAAATGAVLVACLFDGSTSQGFWGVFGSPVAGDHRTPLHLRRKITPSAGSHTYSLRAFRATGNWDVQAGPGGAGDRMPGYIRITKA